MQPIGYINSLFTFKNGTPRQSSICQHARGSLTIEKTVFNNPEHSLEGLEFYSHVWIIFTFHKNNNQYTKAKVKPPRLNGKRVGLFSTRCPYRPNPIGLTLAKLDKVEGSTVHLSGIDLLDGTPVLDIKPYIPDYDCPKIVTAGESETVTAETETIAFDKDSSFEDFENSDTQEDSCSDESSLMNEPDRHNNGTVIKTHDFNRSDTIDLLSCSNRLSLNDNKTDSKDITTKKEKGRHKSEIKITSDELDFSEKKKECMNLDTDLVRYKLKTEEIVNNDSCQSNRSTGTEYLSSRKGNEDFNISTESELNTKTETANWVTKPPVSKLIVRFTMHAEKQLKDFTPVAADLDYRLKYFNNIEEAKSAICDILKEDPRSVYRRKKCEDSLYFFSVDIIHVTCWFDDGMAEVVRIKPISLVQHFNKARK